MSLFPTVVTAEQLHLWTCTYTCRLIQVQQIASTNSSHTVLAITDVTCLHPGIIHTPVLSTANISLPYLHPPSTNPTPILTPLPKYWPAPSTNSFPLKLYSYHFKHTPIISIIIMAGVKIMDYWFMLFECLVLAPPLYYPALYLPSQALPCRSSPTMREVQC